MEYKGLHMRLNPCGQCTEPAMCFNDERVEISLFLVKEMDTSYLLSSDYCQAYIRKDSAKNLPSLDHGDITGWFANAIMAQYDSDCKIINALEAKLKVAREALIPMAAIADAIPDRMRSAVGIWSETTTEREPVRLLVSDVRKAKEALKQSSMEE